MARGVADLSGHVPVRRPRKSAPISEAPAPKYVTASAMRAFVRGWRNWRASEIAAVAYGNGSA